jgi:hypothetical protein
VTKQTQRRLGSKLLSYIESIDSWREEYLSNRYADIDNSSYPKLAVFGDDGFLLFPLMLQIIKNSGKKNALSCIQYMNNPSKTMTFQESCLQFPSGGSSIQMVLKYSTVTQTNSVNLRVNGEIHPFCDEDTQGNCSYDNFKTNLTSLFLVDNFDKNCDPVWERGTIEKTVPYVLLGTVCVFFLMSFVYACILCRMIRNSKMERDERKRGKTYNMM